MKALIDPNQPVSHCIGWEGTPPKPIYADYPNSSRVCEVVQDDQTFGVGEPLYWTDCPNDVVADQWYYDNVTLQFIPVGEAPPKPHQVAPDQPATTGTTTL